MAGASRTFEKIYHYFFGVAWCSVVAFLPIPQKNKRSQVSCRIEIFGVELEDVGGTYYLYSCIYSRY